jgi:hypothetical protein
MNETLERRLVRDEVAPGAGGCVAACAAYWVNEEDTTDWTPEGWAVARLNESA